jgi:cell division protein ZapA (FtsZ GTPase activity inhibitor)
MLAPACGMNENGPVRRERANMKIEIYDQSYTVNSGQSDKYLQELAAYVDAKMRDVAESTHLVDSVKVAVLASLNIADELFTLRERQQQIEGPLRKRVEKCVDLVEKAIERSN